MATSNRSAKSKRLRYFFLNGELHRKLHISRASNLITAWNYPQAKRVSYIWTDTKKNMQNAYTISQVAAMINRHRNRILENIENGNIRRPSQTYTLDEKKSPVKYLMSEDDIMEVRDFFASVHVGRPRKDGLITSKRLPTRQELRASLKNEVLLYQKTEDGDFIPVWKQPDW